MSSESAPLVRVSTGLLSGEANQTGVRVFRGIPYAAPPIGPRRWQPPAPAASWDGVRAAITFGDRCVQLDRPHSSISYFGVEPASEDCLYLNVWTAAETASDRLPVIVWLHGGAFEVGSGALPIFDGSVLALSGAVVVTVNYRLGRLGFLAHPELTAESARESPAGWCKSGSSST